MGKENIFENIDMKKIKEISGRVENNFDKVMEIVNGIIQPYCKALDEYVDFIQSLLDDTEQPPTDQELDDFVLNLSTQIYFAGGMCEQLGIRDDISKAVWKEMYHTSRANIDKGTVADKDSLAELNAQQEQIVNICYNRAYKIMRAKVENAQELLQSCKKVIGRRMQETELTRMGGSGR